jgi:hypothetical protein
MDAIPSATRQPNGDLLVPAQTARLLEQLLERLREDLVALQGKSIAEPGQFETHHETANRQQAVDSLSASVGVTPPKVETRQMPDVHSLADNSELLEHLRVLGSLLFGDPLDSGRGQ